MILLTFFLFIKYLNLPSFTLTFFIIKFSINNIDTYVSSEEFTWKNNDPSCSPANCTNYNEAIQEYTINGEIENVVFSNPIETDYGWTIYNRATFGKVVMERQAEDIFWNNF